MNSPRVGREHRQAILAWLHLARVHDRIQALHTRFFAASQLSPAQFDVLSHAAVAPGLSQQELADRLLVTKGNVCGLIDRMERGGLVERRPDPADRRRNQVHPTEKGERLFLISAPALEAEIANAMGTLSSGEQRQLRRLLGRLDRDLRGKEVDED